MISQNKDLETLKNQFYTRGVSFDNFSKMTPEDIEEVKQQVAFQTRRANKAGANAGLSRYINSLQYLTSPTVSRDFHSFDEKILYLILTVDPNLVTYRTYLSSYIVPEYDIEHAEDEKEKAALIEARNKGKRDYMTKVRNQIGFYDHNLIGYEATLTRTLLKEGLAKNVQLPYIHYILTASSKIKNLDSLYPINIKRLKKIADKIRLEVEDNNSAAYNIITRYKQLRLYAISEQVLLFMLFADPDLNLLTIFKEECTQERIKERAMSELGFYDEEFLRIEQLYHDKFEPEKKISEWSK